MPGETVEAAEAASTVADIVSEVAATVADVAAEAEQAAHSADVTLSASGDAVNNAIQAADAAREVEELAERARQREAMAAADTVATVTADQSEILSRQQGLEEWQRHHEHQMSEVQGVLATVLETLQAMTAPPPETAPEAEPLSIPSTEVLTTAELTTEPTSSEEGAAPRAPVLVEALPERDPTKRRRIIV